MGNAILEMHRLLPHPLMMPKNVTGVNVEVIYADDNLMLTYIVSGAEHQKLPEWTSPERRDRLWEKTCFELFVQPARAETYVELNFSPSTQWAAYQFERYREGMRDFPLVIEPHIQRGDVEAGYVIEVDLDLSQFPNLALQIGLSAVIEEIDGTKSYWALAHPPGKPDFHHRDCFALELAPPGTS
jgi:hypothetical protein